MKVAFSYGARRIGFDSQQHHTLNIMEGRGVKVKRGIAKSITDSLFREYRNRKYAKRLALVYEEGDTKFMSGWCKDAVIDVIERALRHHKEGRVKL